VISLKSSLTDFSSLQLYFYDGLKLKTKRLLYLLKIFWMIHCVIFSPLAYAPGLAPLYAGRKEESYAVAQSRVVVSVTPSFHEHISELLGLCTYARPHGLANVIGAAFGGGRIF